VRKFISASCVVVTLCLASARGQNNGGSTGGANANDQPVSRQEFDQLKKDNADLKQEVTDLKKQQADQATNSQQDADDFEKELKGLEAKVGSAMPGLESVVIAGDANFGFQAIHGQKSTFFADLSPLILWQPPDSHFLFEAAFDLSIGGADVSSESTSVSLNLANLSYDICDFCTIGGGLFTVPFGQYHNHFDPPWINKFPDDPLAFGDDALGPTAEVGFFAKGAIPAGTTKWTYDLYVVNGPNLITIDPAAAGQLKFDDFTDLNNNKAVGGRIGFLPIPEMEMGYSIEGGQVAPSGFPSTDALIQAVDLSYKPTVHAISGTLDFRTEWIWQHVGSATYDPTGLLGFGPATYGSNSNGGYVQLLYRPTEVNNKILRNFEFGFRYDYISIPLSTPGGQLEHRYTFGVDYWFTPYIVVKTAYEVDDRQVGENANAFLLQVGVGL
jgi:hypothetical protein